MLLILLLVSLFLLVLLGFYVFVSAPRNRAHQTFATFVACLALWTAKDIIFWEFSTNDSSAGWWATLSFILSLILQYSLVVFAWVFPENLRTPRKKAAVIFAPGIVLIPAVLFGFLWRRIEVADGKLEIELAPLAYLFVIYVYAMFAYGFGLLYVKYRNYSGTQQSQQIGAILWALIITGILKTTANIALPYLGNYNLLPFSSLFVLPGVLIYAYAISNFQLFSFQTALNQFRLFPITYKIAVSIACVAIASFVVFQIPIVWLAFHDGMGFDAWRKYVTFSLITALVPNLLLVLLVVRTISRPLQRITLAAVQVTEGQYGTEVDLRKSNDEIGLLAESFNEMSRKMAADIEQLRSLNEKLIHTEKLAAMGTLSAGLAHEINNPLASISSLIQMIQTKENDAETREMLHLISTQITRITLITRDMLDFARKRPSIKTRLDLNTVIEISIRLASFDKSFKKLSITKHLEPNLPKIFADGDQLEQVFFNLLLNAGESIVVNKGHVEIVSETQETVNEVIVSIIDNGAGITDENMKHIFDPFFSTKTAGKGTGLGLPVCYGIITAHGGKIEVDRNPAGGSIFKVFLPVENR